MRLTEQINAVINCTPIRVKNKAKLTNFMKLIQIKEYSGEKGSNLRRNKGFFRDILELDQIGQ